MKELKIKGAIISNSEKWIYDWFEEDSTCPNDVESYLNNANGEDVKVIVNSGGGDVLAGNEIRYLLKNYKGNLTIHNVALAASAAAVICTAGKCTSEPTAMFMWHNVVTYASGDYNAMDKASDTLKKANKAIAQALIEKTGKTEAECLEIMNKETWFTAQEALEYGLVDEIAGHDMKLVASYSNNMIPQSVIKKMQAERHEKLVNNKKLELENKFNLLKLKGEN